MFREVAERAASDRLFHTCTVIHVLQQLQMLGHRWCGIVYVVWREGIRLNW